MQTISTKINKLCDKNKLKGDKVLCVLNKKEKYIANIFIISSVIYLCLIGESNKRKKKSTKHRERGKKNANQVRVK